MSKESKKYRVDRRTFLKFAGGTAAVAVAAAAGYSSLRQKSIARMENIADMLSIPQRVFADEGVDDETCTTIVVGKNATADGSVLMSHNEDDGSWNEGNVFIVPHQTHAPGEFYTSYYGAQIPQPQETYSYIWIGDPNVNDIPGDFFNGINEYQVTICENLAASKESWGPGWFSPDGSLSPYPPPVPGPPQASEYKLIWTDFMHLVMQRCKTALEGVQLIAWLTDNYGGDITSTGDMHAIADKNEGWILSKTPHHWCAIRAPNDGYLRMANRLPYGTYDLGSTDLQTFAKDQGWWDGESPFSFTDAYGVASTQNSKRNIYREERIDSLLTPKVGSISVEDLKAIMRDHYEGRTDPADPPYYNVDAVHGSPHVGAKFRNICVPSTESSAVHHLRSYLPDPIGGLMWATLGCSCTSVYLPYYVGTQSVPTPFMTGLPGSTNYDPASAWWTYERLQHTIDNNYPAAQPHVRHVLDAFEKGAENDSKTVEQKALEAYNAGKTQDALSILTAFTTGKLQDGFDLLNGMTVYAYAKTHGLYPSIPGVT